MKKLMFLVCLVMAAPSFAEVYKCTADGKTTFSDKPCVGKGGAIELKVVPASPQAAPASDDAGTAKTNKDRMQANEKIRKDSDARIKTKIINEDIERAEAQMRQLNQKMEQELSALKEKKKGANNNLAGATYEQSISTEMTAVTNSYGNKIALLKSEIERLQREKDELNKK